MLSILIPTYHYNAYPLATCLEKQALKLGVTFELICMDDGSFSDLNKENQKINTLTNCKFIETKKNSGRTATRQKLAESAQYDWLLFMDADTMPVNAYFLELFISEFSQKTAVIFGGIAYEDTKPKGDKSLRWHYGKAREEQPVKARERNPYKSLISGCFAIKKTLFINSNSALTQDAYGLDILFTNVLEKQQVTVKHINNPVFHLGIETNAVYLEKSKKALETLYVLRKQKKISKSQTALLKMFYILKVLGLSAIFGKITYTFNERIETQITSETPKLWLFDLYRLGYFCRIQR